MKRIIYGAGKYGRQLNESFKYISDHVIDYFVQTEDPDNLYIDEIPVIKVDDMFKLNDDLVILIAIKNKHSMLEVLDLIKENSSLFDKHIIIYDCLDFIEKNPLMNNMSLDSGNKKCIICGNSLEHFEPGGIKSIFFMRHKIIGGGYRNNCFCKYCGANDRERWLFYVLKNCLDIDSWTGRVLHFAPEKSIKRILELNRGIDYYSVDINPGIAMHIADITNIEQFRDNTFQYVVSNHVMEHILNEEDAVIEIKRVLKDNGKWIYSFPISEDLDVTYEDKSIYDPNIRKMEYGQENHVRIYGKDYVKRFEKYGLKIKQYCTDDFFEQAEIEKYGFIKGDVILVAEKDE